MNYELHRERLAIGESTQFRPKGNSMVPRIMSGQLVTVEPVPKEAIRPGDVVFCKVNGSYYVHVVQAVFEKMGDIRFQIGNMKGRTNGIVGSNSVFGKVTRIED